MACRKALCSPVVNDRTASEATYELKKTEGGRELHAKLVSELGKSLQEVVPKL